MRVFLTGGTGFVGGHVALALGAAGHAVRALRRRGGVSPPFVEKARAPMARAGRPLLEWVVGDLLDPPSIRAGMDGCEAVVHVAADLATLGSPAARAHQRLVNVDGTRYVVEAARALGVRRLVHTSSVTALGRPQRGLPADENTAYDWPPGLAYGESKRDGEAEALAGQGAGLDVVVLCPALVLGPGDPRRRLSGLLRAIESGVVRVAPPGGVTVCDVRQVAAAHVAALDLGRGGQRYVLGGEWVTWRRFLDELAGALSAPGPLVTLPEVALRLGTAGLSALSWLSPFEQLGLRLEELGSERYYRSDKAVAELHYQEGRLARLVADVVADYRA